MSIIFTKFGRFDRHAEKLRQQGDKKLIDYVKITSPSYFQDCHMRFALHIGADAACKKTLVLNPWNRDAFGGIEKDYGKKINTILQLPNQTPPLFAH